MKKKGVGERGMAVKGDKKWLILVDTYQVSLVL
jgi:hypothetical protein